MYLAIGGAGEVSEIRGVSKAEVRLANNYRGLESSLLLHSTEEVNLEGIKLGGFNTEL